MSEADAEDLVVDLSRIPRQRAHLIAGSHHRNRALDRLVFAQLGGIAQSSHNSPIQTCNEVGEYVEHLATHVRAGADRLDYLGMVGICGPTIC